MSALNSAARQQQSMANAQGTGGATTQAEGEEGSSLTGGGKSKGITVTADVNSNAIIVIAPPAVQQMYAGLVAKLDERRPQVQVECTIVTLDTSDNFSFGVDISKLGGFG